MISKAKSYKTWQLSSLSLGMLALGEVRHHNKGTIKVPYREAHVKRI